MEGVVEVLNKQLLNGTVTVAAACARLATGLHQATADDIKYLHFHLPKLLSILLYSTDSHQPHSWLTKSTSPHDFEAVCQLLSASGPLFTVLLLHSHKAIYDIPAHQLPFMVKKAIMDGRPMNWLRDKLVSGAVLRLDMSEYYLFYLLYLLYLPKEQQRTSTWLSMFQDSQKPRQLTINDLLTLPSTGSLSLQFDDQNCSEAYLIILDSFFKFILPLSDASEKNIFSSKMPQSMIVRLADFFLHLSMEYLLQSCQYDLDDNTRRPVSSISVNIDRVLGMQRLIEHMTRATFVPAQNYATQGLIESTLPIYRVLLYRQLRMLLSSWPLDNTITVWTELWMTAAFPWRTLEERFLIDVAPKQLLLTDFHLFHTLFDDFLETICTVFESWNQLDDEVIDGQALTEQAGPLVASLLDVLLNIERIFPELQLCEAEVSSTFNKSINSRMLLEQLQAREPMEKFSLLLTFSGDGSKNRAAFLASLLEQAKQQISSESILTWIDESVKKLKEMFKFDALVSISRPQMANLGSGGHLPLRSRFPDPSNRITIMREARSDPAAGKSNKRKGEVQVLVRVFEVVSKYLNRTMHHRLDPIPFLGEIIRPTSISLRFLAVPGNLLLSIVTVLVCFYFQWFILKKFVSAILK